MYFIYWLENYKMLLMQIEFECYTHKNLMQFIFSNFKFFLHFEHLYPFTWDNIIQVDSQQVIENSI